MEHKNPAHHLALAKKAKARGDMKMHDRHMAEMKEAKKAKGK